VHDRNASHTDGKGTNAYMHPLAFTTTLLLSTGIRLVLRAEHDQRDTDAQCVNNDITTVDNVCNAQCDADTVNKCDDVTVDQQCQRAGHGTVRDEDRRHEEDSAQDESQERSLRCIDATGNVGGRLVIRLRGAHRARTRQRIDISPRRSKI
jgi:hypothetical protein